MSGWTGVDLDGTLAHFPPGPGQTIGDPVPLMLERVKRWLAQGRDVRIFTARVSGGDSLRIIGSKRADQYDDVAWARKEIEDWCLKHVGKVLPVTCTKDFACQELWDDRAVTVEMNTGRAVGLPEENAWIDTSKM